MTKRPAAIIWFERLYVIGVALSTMALIATWQETMDASADDGAMVEMVAYAVLALVYAATVLFWHLIVRRRSNIARWLLAVITVFVAPLSFIEPDGRPWDFWMLVEAASVAASLAAVISLFVPGARRWFDGSRDDLAETFS